MEGPYKYIGETAVTSTTAITAYIDTTPWGEEGIEALDTGSNPSAGTDLATINARTVGPYIVAFDNAIKNKLIWCDSGYPDVWNPLNFDYLEGVGRGAIEFNRKIYAFTNESVSEKDPNAMSLPALKICNIGTIDGLSIQDVGNGLIWMDYDTVYFADFVTQYGSKGDFPLDIGHRISSSVRRRVTTVAVHSVFFEQKYYLTYQDSEDHLQRTYVWDIDIKAWTQHSMKHLALARGDKTLFSFGAVTITGSIATSDGTGGTVLITEVAHGRSDGDYVTLSGTVSGDHDGTFVTTWVSVDTYKITDTYNGVGTGLATGTKHYAYEHDYSATVAVATGFSDYAGKDYHDYDRVAQTTYHGIATISSSISRSNIRLGGEFRKVFLSSLSLMIDCSVASILATVSGEDDGFRTSKTFTFGTNPETISEYEFVFDESIFADGVGDEAEAGDADEAGFAGYSSSDGSGSDHKKINRRIKSNAVGITLTNTDSRKMTLLLLTIYWKPLPLVA